MQTTKNKKTKRMILLSLSAVIIIVALIIYSLAYFIRQDEVTNRFTASTLDIALIEEKYDQLTQQQRTTLIPNRKLDKDPKIQNTDETNAYVFLKVTVPVAAITEFDPSVFLDRVTPLSYSETINYSYTGNIQEFTAEKSGYYKLEAWGAQGGSALHSPSGNKTDVSSQIDGGKGGYSCGTVYLEKGRTIYICVGGKGESITASEKTVPEGETLTVAGGYNGGGGALVLDNKNYYYLGSGGGATHFALENGTLSYLSEKTDSVLLVAGGGGGSYYRYYESDLKEFYYYGHGGYGGGENGGNGEVDGSNNGLDYTNLFAPGGGQINRTEINNYSVRYGSFGQGVSGTYDSNDDKIQFYDSGAGGGWYGGGKHSGSMVGGGGSGYCNKKLLTAYSVIAGNQSFPDINGNIETGHDGNGCAKITYLSTRNQEVFYLKTEGTPQYITKNIFNNTPTDESDMEYWIELPDCEEGTDLSGNVRTYVFGYSVLLKPDEMTETLFDYIQLKNILQYEISPNKNLIINVQAYGIQADYLDGVENNNTNGLMNKEELTKIYSYIKTPDN